MNHHIRMVSKTPVKAQSSLELKVDFFLNMMDFGLTWIFRKTGGRL